MASSDKGFKWAFIIGMFVISGMFLGKSNVKDDILFTLDEATTMGCTGMTKDECSYNSEMLYQIRKTDQELNQQMSDARYKQYISKRKQEKKEFNSTPKKQKDIEALRFARANGTPEYLIEAQAKKLGINIEEI